MKQKWTFELCTPEGAKTGAKFDIDCDVSCNSATGELTVTVPEKEYAEKAQKAKDEVYGTGNVIIGLNPLSEWGKL